MPWSVRLDLADPLAYGFGCAADLRRPLRSVLSFVLQYHLQAALEDPGRFNQYPGVRLSGRGARCATRDPRIGVQPAWTVTQTRSMRRKAWLVALSTRNGPPLII